MFQNHFPYQYEQKRDAYNGHRDKVSNLVEEIEKHECGITYLKKRKDDNQESIITRYEEYIKKTKPVLDFYSSRTYFHEIDGSQKIQAITNKIEHILKV